MGLFKSLGKALFSPIKAAGRITGLAGGRHQQNPADSAMPYLNQIPGVAKGYFDPFIGQGQEAYNQANPVYNRMTQDPSEFMNSMMRNYSPSEGYKFKERNMLKAAQNSAAQGGFAGTGNDQLNQSQMVQGLLGEDMQQYLSNLLGIQGTGLQGQENQMGQGYNASGQLADMLGANLGQQGALGYQGMAQRNQNQNDRRANRMKFTADILGAGAGMFGMGSDMGGGMGGRAPMNSMNRGPSGYVRQGDWNGMGGGNAGPMYGGSPYSSVMGGGRGGWNPWSSSNGSSSRSMF